MSCMMWRWIVAALVVSTWVGSSQIVSAAEQEQGDKDVYFDDTQSTLRGFGADNNYEYNDDYDYYFDDDADADDDDDDYNYAEDEWYNDEDSEGSGSGDDVIDVAEVTPLAVIVSEQLSHSTVSPHDSLDSTTADSPGVREVKSQPDISQPLQDVYFRKFIVACIVAGCTLLVLVLVLLALIYVACRRRKRVKTETLLPMTSKPIYTGSNGYQLASAQPV